MNSMVINEIMTYGEDFWNEVNSNKDIIIYGGGVMCRKFIDLYGDVIKDRIKNIAVTSLGNNVKEVCGIKVVEIDELKFNTDVLVLLAVKSKFVTEIKETLNALGFNNIIVVNYNRLRIFKMYEELRTQAAYCDTQPLFAKNEVIYAKTLNLGAFISSLPQKCLEFSAVDFTWGGSGLLDYALLRGLVVKYNLRTYCEIGTYIGGSLKAVADLVDSCYSITVPESHPAHMKNWCKLRHVNDYSNKLVCDKNMIQFQIDSRQFEFSNINKHIDLYFIDGDHSYAGIFIDTINVFSNFDKDNDFVVWHDCRTALGVNSEAVDAIRDAIGSYFDNFYIFNNNMCGIYIPDKYIDDFVLASETDELMTYKVSLECNLTGL